MKKEITYPKFVKHGVGANHRAYPLGANLRVFGADTETYYGKPHTLQMYDGERLSFAYVESTTVFDAFTSYVAPKCRSRGVNIVYFHYLRFDMPVLFIEKRMEIYEQISDIEFDYHGWEVKMLFGKVNKATLRKDDITFHIFDSWAFTQAGLAASLDMYKIPHPKLEKSKALESCIGRRRFDRLSHANPLRVEFESYAKQDAVSEFHLAKAIMQKHEEYKVRPSISLPQFAARVFRHHFFKQSEVIEFPPKPCVKASELSYHGGKNGYYLDKPSIIEDAYEVDISSAYPYAMSQLPQFMEGVYIRTNKYDPDCPGVYRISGAQLGKYPIVFDHEFKPVKGKFKNLWISGFELACALKSSDVAFTVHEGWLWMADRTYTHNPMSEYISHFYKLKQASNREDANYYFYKTMMNGLYGKFCQVTTIKKIIDVCERRMTVDHIYDSVTNTFVAAETKHVAGGLYNPFIATQITGFVRKYLWELETKYEAFHSATDAIKTTIKPEFVPGLGGLKIETFGRCYAFRNKLYLHYAKDFSYCNHKPEKISLWDGRQHLCKYGLHGFKGEASDLHNARHKLINGEAHEYEYDHMIGLREGFKHKEAICSMVSRRETLSLNKIPLHLPRQMVTISG